MSSWAFSASFKKYVALIFISAIVIAVFFATRYLNSVAYQVTLQNVMIAERERAENIARLIMEGDRSLCPNNRPSEMSSCFQDHLKRQSGLDIVHAVIYMKVAEAVALVASSPWAYDPEIKFLARLDTHLMVFENINFSRPSFISRIPAKTAMDRQKKSEFLQLAEVNFAIYKDEFISRHVARLGNMENTFSLTEKGATTRMIEWKKSRVRNLIHRMDLLKSKTFTYPRG